MFHRKLKDDKEIKRKMFSKILPMENSEKLGPPGLRFRNRVVGNQEVFPGSNSQTFAVLPTFEQKETRKEKKKFFLLFDIEFKRT